MGQDMTECRQRDGVDDGRLCPPRWVVGGKSCFKTGGRVAFYPRDQLRSVPPSCSTTPPCDRVEPQTRHKGLNWTACGNSTAHVFVSQAGRDVSGER